MATVKRLINEVRVAAKDYPDRVTATYRYLDHDMLPTGLIGLAFYRLPVLPACSDTHYQNQMPIGQLLVRLGISFTEDERLWLTYVQEQVNRGSRWGRAIETADTYLRIRKEEERLRV